MRRAAFLIVVAALAGCSSADKKDADKPSVQNGPQDPPTVDTDNSPPIGKPKGKVPPSAMEKRSDTIRGTLLEQSSPH